MAHRCLCHTGPQSNGTIYMYINSVPHWELEMLVETSCYLREIPALLVSLQSKLHTAATNYSIVIKVSKSSASE